MTWKCKLKLASLLVLSISALLESRETKSQVGAIEPYQEYVKTVKSTEMVGAMAGNLFGESVSLYNGSSEFSVANIDLPGNNSLPVRLGRRLKIESREFAESIGGFGAWDVDTPYIYGVFDAGYG